MKGIVFCEFIELVEEAFSPEFADEIIVESSLDSDGAYTSVATYDYQELLTLVTKLSEKTGESVPNLVKAFGKHLAARFATLYPDFFSSATSTFEFLETVENHIHVEVRKLYTDAETPSFETKHVSDSEFHMLYSSKRPFADLAEGLIMGTSKHFNETLSIEREDWREGEMNIARFTLHLRD